MAQTQPQSFENHTRLVPPFHMVALPIFLVNLLWAIYRMFRVPGVDSLVALLLAVAFILLSLYARFFALTVQDRVIRLEMQLRLKGLLPPDLQARIPELTPRQFVALRFASDEELPELCRTVLRDNITEARTIKKMIKSWKADHLRA
jgi:uncharacterized protein DUF6526